MAYPFVNGIIQCWKLFSKCYLLWQITNVGTLIWTLWVLSYVLTFLMNGVDRPVWEICIFQKRRNEQNPTWKISKVLVLPLSCINSVYVYVHVSLTPEHLQISTCSYVVYWVLSIRSVCFVDEVDLLAVFGMIARRAFRFNCMVLLTCNLWFAQFTINKDLSPKAKKKKKKFLFCF